MIESKYGHFSENGREYIITNPETPRPWINIISNGDYSIVVSQTGGGFSFRDNAEQNRLTRLFQDIVKDNWGKYFYVRDLENGKYFSTSFKPIKDGYDKYEVHVGIGYTKFIRVQNGLEVTTTFFVDSKNPFEYITVKIKDLSGRDRKLDLTSYFEWAPGLAYDNAREFQKLFQTVRFDKNLNSVLVTKCLWGFPDEKGRANNDDWPFVGFFTCSEKIDSFDCDKEAFIGMYNDEASAKGMKEEKLSNSEGRYGDPCSATRVLVSLKANEEKEIVYSLGMANKETEDYKEFIKKCSVKDADVSFDNVQKFWSNLLDKDVCKTGDLYFDTFTNIWSKYQAISCRLWAKAAYYQISGGIGYRDQLQDSLVFLFSNPELTKKQILLHASKQFYKGDVYHWWLTIKSWGPRGNCSDDFLWLPFATIDYIKETGDFSILNEKAPYVDSDKEETIFEHIKKAIFRSIELTSKRGVPLMGDHDWNDGLSAVGHDLKGESFWVSEFLYYILNNIDPLIDFMHDDEFKKVCHDKKELTKKTFNEYAWDGEYFLQATNDYGELIGSHTSKEGKVFLNPQIWSVISDITDEDRKKKAMKAVDEYLLRDYGALLLYPAFENPNKEVGYITRYAPGLRENGGVYTHAATWATWAYALMGDNEKAYDAYIRICPPYRSNDIDKYKAEPYVTCGNSDGPISPNYGQGGWSWYSGSAQWMHNVAITSILGIRGDIDKVYVNPCVPDNWDSFTYDRKFDKKFLHFEAKRTGVKKLVVNGKEVKEGYVKIFENIDEYNVLVEF